VYSDPANSHLNSCRQDNSLIHGDFRAPDKGRIRELLFPVPECVQISEGAHDNGKADGFGAYRSGDDDGQLLCPVIVSCLL
jgi:hypothetical protein